MLGPLIRYSEFAPQYAKTEIGAPSQVVINREWWSRLALAIGQLAAGVVLSYLTVRIDALPQRWPKLLITFGSTPWGMYCGSSGKFHLMECLALIWIIDLPISFNYPFGQQNVSEFWARWNMTVVRACRDYLFYNRWGFRTANLYFNLMFVFIAVGLWHDINWYWFLWGALNGLGFCVYLYYRSHRDSFLSLRQKFPATIRNLWSRALTYVFVCLCLYVAGKIAMALTSLNLAKRSG